MKMAKPSRSGPAASASSTLVDDATLRQEVSALASQLGLTAATGVGTSAGFNDRDFRPKPKKQPTKATTGKQHPPSLQTAQQPRQQSGQKRRREEEGKLPKDDRRVDGKKPRSVDAGKGRTPAKAGQAAEAAPAAPAPAAVKTRNWNAGIGPRPGEAAGKSLLARDAPNIWWQAAEALPPMSTSATGGGQQALPEQEVAALRARAEAAMAHEAELFEGDLGRQSGQDARWLAQVRTSGTVADKVAAMTLLVQESPMANLKSLDTLVGWVGKRAGGRGVVGQAIDALRELFVSALLPDRKLKFFEQQPLAAVSGGGRDAERALLYFHLEDCIKKRYMMYIAALEECSRDSLDFLKEKALKALAQLLQEKAEGEAALLTALVNKLGDPSRKLASKAGYLLSNLLIEHPAMKLVVVREVERFMFRPGLQARARYYAVVFLNQLALSHKAAQGGVELAKKLIDVYFTLFALIMTGQLGHAAEDKSVKEEKAAAAAKGRDKGRWRKAAGGKGGKGRGKGAGGGPGQGRRPAAAPRKALAAGEVDARMLGALIAGVRRAFPFVPPEEVEPLVEKHGGALFRVIHQASFTVAVQGLMLLFQVMASRSAVNDRFYRALYEVLLSPEVARSSKGPMFLSLLFKAVKADVSAKRVAAFAKRLLQVACEALPAFAAGTLFLLSELLKAKPALWSALLQPEEGADDVEHFADLPDGDDGDALEAGGRMQSATLSEDQQDAADTIAGRGAERGLAGALNGHHRGRAGAGAAGRKQGEAEWPGPGAYDMRKREPAYCGAERSCWWEVTALASHAHPSVAAMARTLLAGASVVYEGDPLRDLSFSAFLDKFVQRKPKVQARGSSLMQPLGGQPKVAGPSAAEIGSAAFAAMAETEVAPDALFFHKYFNLAAVQAKRGVKKGKKRGEDEGEEASETDSDSEADIDAFLLGEEADDGEGAGDGEEDEGVYDYGRLAAAMDESEEEAGPQSSGDAEVSGGGEDEVSGAEGGGADSSDEDGLAESLDASDEGAESSDGDGGRGGAGQAGHRGGGRKSKSRQKADVFASADEYEEMIAKGEDQQ